MPVALALVRPDHEPPALEDGAVELGDGPLRRLLGLERRQREALRLAPAVALHLAGDDGADAPEPREERLGRDGPAQVAHKQRGLVARVLVERVDRRRAPIIKAPLFPSKFGCADRRVRGKGGAELVEREVRRLGVLVLAWRRVVPAGHGCSGSPRWCAAIAALVPRAVAVGRNDLAAIASCSGWQTGAWRQPNHHPVNSSASPP